jgi:hypothetical protein
MIVRELTGRANTSGHGCEEREEKSSKRWKRPCKKARYKSSDSDFVRMKRKHE